MPTAIKGQSSGGVDLLGLAYLAIVLAVIFAPVLFARRSKPLYSDAGSDDGGGVGPRRPPDRPSSPLGGLPLPDADQSRTRLRDHIRPADRSPVRSREPAHRPDRPPTRTTPAP
jgi:hypothetical protein